MRFYLTILFMIVLLVSCGIFNSSESDDTILKVYACNQSSGYVTVVDMITMEPIDTIYSHISMEMMEDSSVSSVCSDYSDADSCSDSACMWMGTYCMENIAEDPHHIAIDEDNGLWFNTTIMSGYVGMYSLETDKLIASVEVGDQPALMALDKSNKKLYVSRMMPMVMDNGMMMGSESSSIQQISYTNTSIEKTDVYEIDSPSPHAIAISSDGRYVYTVSNTADWIYKIDTNDGSSMSVSMEGITSVPTIETNKLKPIFCSIAEDKFLFVSCQGGQYTSNLDIEYAESKVQMWNAETLELIDEHMFSTNSSAWHTVPDEGGQVLYVALSGEPGGSGLDAGVAALNYTDNSLSLDWINTQYNFSLPHGIDINSDGLIVSDRGIGNLYKIDPQSGDVDGSLSIDSRFVTGVASMSYKTDAPKPPASSNESGGHHHHH